MTPDERTERLKKLHAAGIGYGRIAVELGLKSKNAVSGLVYRLGLSAANGKRRSQSRAQMSAAGRARRLRVATASPTVREKVADAGGADAWVKKHLAKPLKEPEPLPPLEPVTMRKTFDQLEDGDCRWPVGDPRHDGFGFCGLPKVAGRPYCPDCCRRASGGPAPKSINQLVIRGALAKLG